MFALVLYLSSGHLLLALLEIGTQGYVDAETASPLKVLGKYLLWVLIRICRTLSALPQL